MSMPPPAYGPPPAPQPPGTPWPPPPGFGPPGFGPPAPWPPPPPARSNRGWLWLILSVGAVIVLAEATVAIVFFLRGSGDPSMVSPPGALQLRGTGRLGTRLPALGSRIGQVCLADKLGSGQVAAAQVRFSGSVAVIEVCPTPGTDSALDNACTFVWQHLRIRS